MGGNPLKSAITGGVGSLAGSALSNIMGTGGNTIDVGKIVGSAAASTLVSSLIGGGKSAATTGTGSGSTIAPSSNNSFTFPTPTTPSAMPTTSVNTPTVPFYGVGFGGGGGGGADTPAGDDYSYWDENKKLKQLMASLQQQGGSNGFV